MTGTVSADIPVAAESRPRHVAIIMDGNNRWAKAHRLKGVAGHKAGVGAVRAVVETCAREGVEVLTLFAFSSENWRRPKDEVSALMRLFLFALEREVRKLHRNGIRLRIIGDRSAFSPALQEHMEKAEELTRDNTRMTLVIAANYGGHWDITQATRKVAEQVREGKLEPSDITDDLIQEHLCIGDLPMPDLMIRTAGEQRISNFMLWHLAYTEFYFSPVFWPDFKEEEMHKALQVYSGRQRRFGQTDDQIAAKVSLQER
ncbi:di-trans,poly-cis-decaprenylcistransferase [Marinobacter salinexigens]|uniref:Ditrans,polycis-undecaprenyl-diphosphate synthase ((2E,6E)-farnesyl-diphosphate specific) n=1 Tax=Marinobacter salinexigens TaxID=2919747 RepID=A0A5B0VAC4_9GAMM|nr:polyprenyl diphosphate synthase [Marinobacter salinexigens]KAA1171143.1 di-trans,poly-cis-decaprenylcistransferase [Marinobacter salinexigens]